MNIEQTTKRIEEFTDLVLSGVAGQGLVAQSIGTLEIASFSRADVMRGVAEKILPRKWEWEVVESVCGNCFLVIKSIG